VRFNHTNDTRRKPRVREGDRWAVERTLLHCGSRLRRSEDRYAIAIAPHFLKLVDMAVRAPWIGKARGKHSVTADGKHIRW